ncbi:MAG: class I SAM-dependent methyltransferase [Verrucomicrobia bacterium]|nr:class I SAM-dependent methyltransferase [Verrucomicrobiota bacterium]
MLDRYDTTFVLKLYSAAWLPRVGEVIRWLSDALPSLVGRDSVEPSNERNEASAASSSGSGTPAQDARFTRASFVGNWGPTESHPVRLVLRLSRNIQSLAEKEFKLRDGQVLLGTTPAGPVVFLETGIRFEAEVVRGQKTGFFLDQRENRRRVETLAAGRDVLNAFSFSGGFSLYAARGDARSTTDLDISPHALDSARRNFALNTADPHIAACRHECAQADTFDWLAASSRADFDLVILDPPSLAKREAERTGAIQAYRRLALLGLPRLRPGGILVAASCSAHVSAPEFYDAVLDALRTSRRKFVELTRTAHAPDHPAAFPEAQYLKCLFARLQP